MKNAYCLRQELYLGHQHATFYAALVAASIMVKLLPSLNETNIDVSS
jgi:hypothetical protein